MPGQEPIRIISDIHYGHGASHVTAPEELAPLFRDTGTVIFNGDTVETRFVEDRPQAEKNLEAIRQICLGEGAQPLFLNGNHDPNISTVNHLDLCGGAVLLTHGDLLFHDISPWSPEAETLGAAHSREIEGLGSDALNDFEQRLSANKRAALAIELRKSSRPHGPWARIFTVLREGWPPWRPLQIIGCWMQVPAKAVALAETFRPQAKFVVIGHTHYSGIWRRKGRIIINTGSFLPISGLTAVEIEGSRLTVRKINRRDRQFSLGKQIATFDACL